MTLPNSISYLLYDNPLCRGAADYLVKGVQWLGGSQKHSHHMASKGTSTPPAPPVPLWKLARSTGPFIRLAGLSGAIAVTLGAYGAHAIYLKDIPQERKTAFETANRYHFLHTIALLAAPLCRRPVISGSLMATGTLIFCGCCYHYALTGDPSLKPVTPYGGVLLIIAWLSFML